MPSQCRGVGGRAKERPLGTLGTEGGPTARMPLGPLPLLLIITSSVHPPWPGLRHGRGWTSSHSRVPKRTGDGAVSPEVAGGIRVGFLDRESGANPFVDFSLILFSLEKMAEKSKMESENKPASEKALNGPHALQGLLFL